MHQHVLNWAPVSMSMYLSWNRSSWRRKWHNDQRKLHGMKHTSPWWKGFWRLSFSRQVDPAHGSFDRSSWTTLLSGEVLRNFASAFMLKGMFYINTFLRICIIMEHQLPCVLLQVQLASYLYLLEDWARCRRMVEGLWGAQEQIFWSVRLNDSVWFYRTL